jgi:hypothetical protein
MSVSTDIKNHIKANIQSCPSVDQVYGHEEINPTGWPAVVVTAGDMQGEFASNAENSRVYSFRIQIFFPIGKNMPGMPAGTNRMEYAEQVVATVIDEIINVSDYDFELDGADATVLFVKAANVLWSYTNMESGDTRSAELTLAVYTEKRVVGV